MSDSFTVSIPNIAHKLKVARDGSQLSTRAVAQKLVGRFQLSHATIANYEKGRSVPTIDILKALAAVYERPFSWFTEPGSILTGVRYRNLKSKVRVSERHRYESVAQQWLEAYAALEKRLKKPLQKAITSPTAAADPAAVAASLRKHLELSALDPVPSVIACLHQLGVRTIELPTTTPIDGFAARFGDEFVVVLNSLVSNDRCRMNAAHEMVHVVEGDCNSSSAESREIEKRAYSVASHFLIPDARLQEAFRGRSLVRMVEYKERFGISLAAMVFRAQESRLIDARAARWLWVEFARRGWRKTEPGYVRPDRATRFEDMLDSAIQKKKMSWREAESLMGVRESELRERLKLAMGIQPTPEGAEGDDIAPQILKLAEP